MASQRSRAATRKRAKGFVIDETRLGTGRRRPGAQRPARSRAVGPKLLHRRARRSGVIRESTTVGVLNSGESIDYAAGLRVGDDARPAHSQPWRLLGRLPVADPAFPGRAPHHDRALQPRRRGCGRARDLRRRDLPEGPHGSAGSRRRGERRGTETVGAGLAARRSRPLHGRIFQPGGGCDLPALPSRRCPRRRGLRRGRRAETRGARPVHRHR